MDAVLNNIVQSPKLYDYVQELQQYLHDEEAKRHAFYENVRDDEKAEFINGEVIYHSPAREKHNVVVENLGTALQFFARKGRLGVIRREKAMIKLRRNDFEPDICFFRKEVADTFEPDKMFYPAPDFIVEVLSSSTEKVDRGVKFVDYALNGVKEYWIVDPNKKFVEQCYLENSAFILAEKVQHGTVCCKALKGLEIPLQAIFDEDENEAFIKRLF